MKIKKLEIFGFKTFPKPTEILFHEGITSVVGPNGCGKSNIIDAMRWVMGEKSAKGLRGEAMGDIIFSGCESRKPLSYAEVTLTLTDVEGCLPEKFGNYHEIAVTRRLDRNGESEYFINKTPCRLRDITELFLDTGLGKRAYSIVEQGRIDAILSSKPVERRYLIEEAAGLSKYRARRDEALVKMRHTSENLERLTDIMTEVGREMGSLKRQAGRARAFKELRSEKRGLERQSMIHGWRALAEKLAAAADEVKLADEALAAARVEADRLSLELEALRLSLLEKSKKHEDCQRIIYSLKGQISERESRSGFLEKETGGLAERSRGAEEESKNLERQSASVLEEMNALDEEFQRLSARIEADEDALVELMEAQSKTHEAKRKAEHAIEEKKRDLFAVSSRLSTLATNLDHAQRREREAQRRLGDIERDMEDLSGKIDEVSAEAESHKKELHTAKNAHENALEERETVAEDLEDAVLHRDNLQKRVETTRRELGAAESQLEALSSLKDNLDIYGEGVKAYLRHAREKKLFGVRGVMADAISVPGRYEAALEAALGERLQYVVVADSLQAFEAVDYLKGAKAGRSSFAPVDARDLKAVKMPEVKEPWAHGPLVDLVRIEPGSDRLARALLGSFYVVERLENALELWRSGASNATFVTLEGETVSPEGVVSGGVSSVENAGLLKRNREIRELSDLVSRQKAALEEAEESYEEARTRHRELEARINFIKEEAHRHELKVADAKKNMDINSERKTRLAERYEALEFERDNVERELSRLTEQMEEMEESRQNLLMEQERVDEELHELKTAQEDAQIEQDRAQQALSEAKVRTAADRGRKTGIGEQVRTLGQQRTNFAERAKRLKLEAQNLEKEREERLAELQKVKIEREELERELGRREESFSEIMENLGEERGAVGEQERAASEARRSAEIKKEALTTAQFGLRELEIQAGALREKFSEHTEVQEGADAGMSSDEELPEDFDPAKAQEKIIALNEKLKSFGEINLLADTEYEDRKTRFDFLEKQKADLDQSLESLKSAIQRINRISRERFDETFNAVNEKFQEVFPTLFRGGNAELFLTNPEDLLETGIDINVQPPGKRPQNLSLLSGGEKALTAVALIFSLFLVKPSPFCILDEVDAPLDDPNVERFTDMLRQMAGATQFMVVTHNKITMEAAAHLYGVTMTEPGVTDLVSVRLTAGLSEVAA
ncbi:chromosome segregation protein SMC [bacterium]|nr:MAG: chromosome segregation protein SMC [bacterium]